MTPGRRTAPAGTGAVESREATTPADDPMLPFGDDTEGVQRAEDNADTWWWDGAMRAVRILAEGGHVFEPYDVTLLGVADPDHPNRWGALFRAAAGQGIIRHHGYAKSRRPSRASGLVRTYVGNR